MSSLDKRDFGTLIVRLMVGAVFVFHGSQKLFGAFGGPGLDGFAGFLGTLGVPFPALNALLAGSAELFGGLALLLGVGMRLLSLPLVFTMLVASATAHTGFDIQKGGAEYALTLGAVVAGLALIGPGELTVAALYRRLRGAPAPQATPVPAPARV